MKHYKLLRRNADGKLRSYTTAVVERLCVVYEENKEIRATETAAENGYHLLVFRTFEDVFMFLIFVNDSMFKPDSNGVSMEVWEVETSNPIRPLPPRCVFVHLNDGFIPGSIHWPAGTEMVETLQLVSNVSEAFREYTKQEYAKASRRVTW